MLKVQQHLRDGNPLDGLAAGLGGLPAANVAAADAGKADPLLPTVKLGPHQITIGGRETNPRFGLKEQYAAIEEAKADVTGLFALQFLMTKADKGQIQTPRASSRARVAFPIAFRAPPPLGSGGGQHGMAEIAPETGCAARGFKSHQQVAGAAAEVENARLGPLQYGADFRHRTGSPISIDVERQQMISEIVAMGHAPEHVADPA